MNLLLLLAVAGVITASLKAWLAIARRWRRALAARGVRAAPDGALDGPGSAGDRCRVFRDECGTAASGLCGLPAHEALGKLDFRDVVNSLAATSLANLATVAFAIGWIRLAAGATWSDLGLRFDRVRDDVRLGLAAFAAVSVPIYLLQALLSQFVQEEHPIITLLKEHRQPWLLALCAFSAVIVAPLAEEFFFRVLLQGWLESLAARTALLRGEVRTDPTEAEESASRPGFRGQTRRFACSTLPLDRENPYAAPDSMAATPDASRDEIEPASTDGPDEGQDAGGVRWQLRLDCHQLARLLSAAPGTWRRPYPPVFPGAGTGIPLSTHRPTAPLGHCSLLFERVQSDCAVVQRGGRRAIRRAPLVCTTVHRLT